MFYSGGIFLLLLLSMIPSALPSLLSSFIQSFLIAVSFLISMHSSFDLLPFLPLPFLHSFYLFLTLLTFLLMFLPFLHIPSSFDTPFLATLLNLPSFLQSDLLNPHNSYYFFSFYFYCFPPRGLVH